MSTRATIHFQYGNDTLAIVYRHWDGDRLGEDLQRFFQEVEHECSDRRYNDPQYLAAKFIVWQAGQYAKDRKWKPLDFLGVGICLEDPGDIEYRYKVKCTGNIRPTVEVEEVTYTASGSPRW